MEGRFYSNFVFYSEIEFFLNNILDFADIDDYYSFHLSQPWNSSIEGSLHDQLEGKVDQIKTIEEKVDICFNSSEIDLTSCVNNKTIKTDYYSTVTKLAGSNELVFLFINRYRKKEREEIVCKFNGSILNRFENNQSYFWVLIYPETDAFTISVNEDDFSFSKQEILKSSSFIKLK